MSPDENTPSGSSGSDFFGPLERSGVIRGWLLVAAVVVVGALILPSATRPGLGTAASAGASQPNAAAQSGETTTTTTSPPPSSTTTTTTAPVAVAPSSVKVLVANGTNTNGAAASVSSLLSGKGYSTLTPIDALTVVHASQVYAIGGDVAAARAVLAALGLSAAALEPAGQPVPVASTGNANVVVVVGPDLTSRV